ncbi:MAG: hypothetical protein CSB01_04505 [Bacteroidia bacterium]|nr:MAG: hypothetical protein CSB01_04505 [Bacteroidia bacterium]
MDKVDMIIAGRQAIDGDTAQVGPQVAEKLGMPQITYAEEIVSVDNETIIVKRRLERGVETVEGKLPMMVSVNGSAPDCRPRNAKFMMKYKHACTHSEMQNSSEDYITLHHERPYLIIDEWSVNDIETNRDELGLSGSPTKVKSIENVVFQAKEAKVLAPTDEAIDELMKELITNHTIG